MRTAFALPALALLLRLFVACSDHPHSPLGFAEEDAYSPSAIGVATSVPPRTQSDTVWGRRSTEELWQFISAHNKTVVVGLKAPGSPRGIWRGRLLVDQRWQAEGRTAIDAIPGLKIVQTVPNRPMVEVEVAGPQPLEQLRRLPFVDYVEPAEMEVHFSSGCGWDDVHPWSYPTAFGGDRMPAAWSRDVVQIDRAWRRSDGRGTIVGVPDTGVHPDQALLRARFNEAPYVAPTRWVHHTYTTGSSEYEGCSHGSRIAGIITAPMNNSNSTGIAFRSDLVSVRMMDGVYNEFGHTMRIRLAIEIASDRVPDGFTHHHRRIVNLSWGSPHRQGIQDEIEGWYWGGFRPGVEVLFVGAAGQFHGGSVLFPASLPEVIAVSAVNSNYSQRTFFSYGPKIELAFFYDSNTHQLSPGRNPDLISSVGMTSSTAAAVSGIAALVWSRYPSANRDWVRNRLRAAGHIFPYHNHTVGYGVPNAMKAVGGLYATHLDAPFWVDPYATFAVSVTPQGGTGPFQYAWSNGATTPSTTYTAGAAGTAVEYSVHVTDTNDGTVRTHMYTSYVEDRSGCDNPDIFIC